MNEGVNLMVKYILAGTVMICAVSTFAAGLEVKEFDLSQIKKIEIKNPKGEVSLTGSKSNKKISVSIEKIQFDSKCKFQTEVTGNLLRVAVTHESGLFEKTNCLSKIKIDGPATLSEIEVSTGSGNVSISGIDAAVDFKTASGNVVLKGETLKNVSGKTATGNVNLAYQNCPKRADIDLMSATGDADIFLGNSCKIRVAYKSATGELFNEMGDSEDYQVLVSMKSASGNLKLKKTSK
jgi:autotransporter translocation and assembly factor TamB